LRHDDPDVYAWYDFTQKILERAFGENTSNPDNFSNMILHTYEDDEDTQAEHVRQIKIKKAMLRQYIKELEIFPPPPASPPSHGGKLAENIHFHGPNARLNHQSTDNSSNTASISNERIFIQLREQTSSIDNARERAAILNRIDALETTHGTRGFMAAYQAFMVAAANHVTVFAPLLPALAQMLPR
jgi:hypothetical protein